MGAIGEKQPLATFRVPLRRAATYCRHCGERSDSDIEPTVVARAPDEAVEGLAELPAVPRCCEPCESFALGRRVPETGQ